MKAVLAYDILQRAKTVGIQNACELACQSMTERFEGDGGVIALDSEGNVGIAFSSERMAWAYQKMDTLYSGIEKEDFFEQPVVVRLKFKIFLIFVPINNNFILDIFIKVF